MSTSLSIIEDDLSGPAIAALIQFHFDEMHRWSPRDSCHVMTVERLRSPDVNFFSAWDGEALAGCGALKVLDTRHGELKSMRAAPAYRGKGVGKALLLHLIAEARARGHTRLSLETGSGPMFEPAQGLYRAHGFERCAPFADYREDPFSVFMTRVF